MTILGAIVEPGGERALAWADTELSTRGLPSGFGNKLLVNAAASMVCVATGWGRLARAAAAVAESAASLDVAADRMPSRLRSVADAILKDGRVADPEDYGRQSVLLVGLSPEGGCIYGIRFSGTAGFSPVLFTTYASPGHVEPFDVADPAALVATAKRQAEELRAWRPGVIGGRLTAALIQPGTVTTHVVYDLAANHWLLPMAAGVMPPLQLAEAA